MQYKLSLLLAAFVAVVAADPHVDSPAQLLTCQPAKLSYTGTGPFFVAILPGGNPSAAPLENLGQQTGVSLVWTPDLAAGTSITVAVTDSTGQTAYSSEVYITEGSSTACVGDAAAQPADDDSATSDSATSAAAPATKAAAGVTSSVVAAARGAASSASAAVASVTSSLGNAANQATDESSSALPLAHLGAAALFSTLVASLVLA